MMKPCRLLLLAALAVAWLPGCSPAPPSSSGDSGQKPAQPPAAAPAAPAAAAAEPDEPLPPVPSPFDALPPGMRERLNQERTGDLDAMIKARVIRAGVVYNRTQYFIEKGVQRGIAYESIKMFEDALNKRLKTGNLKVHVAFIPLSRDQLFPALQSGKVDFITAALTITPERKAIVDFTNPIRGHVSEIVVTAQGVPPVANVDGLSGRSVFVRRSSSYYDSLTRLNKELTGKHLAPVTIKEAPEALEDDDLLEMVNAGLVDATIVDDYIVDFWRQVFHGIVPNPGAAVRTGGEIAVGVRKNNPRMAEALNVWIKKYGARTAFGNTMRARYLENANYVKNAASEKERQKFDALVKLFQTYGEQYKVDYLLMVAQGYQESRLDQKVKSPVGAIGVMQVMPATGKELNVGDIASIEPNIHAGVKYFRFMMDQYFKNEPMDNLNKGLMTFASYNAGPNRVRQLRKEAAKQGLDPNRWFGNVERVASERIGRETVQYVSNIYKYYVAYTLVLERNQARVAAKGQAPKK